MDAEEKGSSSAPEINSFKDIGAKHQAPASSAVPQPEAVNPPLPIASAQPDTHADKLATADDLPAQQLKVDPGRESTVVSPRQEAAVLPKTGLENSSGLITDEKHEKAGEPKRQFCIDPRPSSRQTEQAVPFDDIKPHHFFHEQTLPVVEIDAQVLRNRTRREVLAFGISMAAMATGAAYLLPQDTLKRLGVRRDLSSRGKEWLLNNALRVDDDVAEALYSPDRMVPTYTKSAITTIKNNYNGATPEPWYLPGWNLTLDGLASGVIAILDVRTLRNRFSVHDQITRFVCVEGWSAIAWWAGLRFDDLLRAYPPKSQAKWARVESSVNLDSSGNPDPYFVSIDLATARHPQTLLATHHDGQPLTVEHGAPLRLLVPVKLGLKNVKAITRITYSAEEPKDYWARYGYSSYDGI